MIVIIESPYAGDIQRNLRYLRACLRDSLLKGECPIATHGLYTQDGVLNDTIPEEREIGMNAGSTLRKVAQKTVVYFDLGISDGMQFGIDNATKIGQEIEYRSIKFDLEIDDIQIPAEDLTDFNYESTSESGSGSDYD